MAYGENVKGYEGPLYKSMKIKKGKIILSFDTKGSSLITKGGNELGYFAIAGDDKEFVWAKAIIKGKNKIEVWSNQISSPKAVRYAWANNPDGCNLYNVEGLPASPFRTDSW